MTVAEETAVDAADDSVDDVDQSSRTDLRLRTSSYSNIHTVIYSKKTSYVFYFRHGLKLFYF